MERRTDFAWVVTAREGVPVVECHGEMDAGSCADLRDAIAEAAENARHLVVVDLRDVAYISSGPVGMLVGLSGTLRSQGGMLATVCSPGHVGRLLRVMGLEAALGLTSDLDSACRRLARLSGLPEA